MKPAGTVLALIACVAMLLSGVLRLTHHHDGMGAPSAQSLVQADNNGHQNHDDHEDSGCAICKALSAHAVAITHAGLVGLFPPEKFTERAEIRKFASSGISRRAAWLSRAPPAA